MENLESEISPSLMFIGRFVMSSYKYALLYIASGRCNFFNMNKVMWKCIAPKFFESGQPNYQLLMLVTILESLRFPECKDETMRRGFVTMIRNHLSYFFTDEAQEWANLIFENQVRTIDPTHMRNIADALDEMHKIQYIMNNQWSHQKE